MKTLIFNAWIGQPVPTWAHVAHGSTELMAKRHGHDYRLFAQPMPPSYFGNKPHPFWGTFSPFFTGEYRDFSSMLYVDSDVFCRPTTPDPFSAMAQDVEGEGIGMTHLCDGPCRDGKHDEVLGHVRALGVQNETYLDHGHANAGVVWWPPGTVQPFGEWLLDNFQRLAPTASNHDPRVGTYPFGSYDQTVLNIYRITHGAGRLPCRWNYHLTQFRPDAPEFAAAHLVHCHGGHKEQILSL